MKKTIESIQKRKYICIILLSVILIFINIFLLFSRDLLLDYERKSKYNGNLSYERIQQNVKESDIVRCIRYLKMAEVNISDEEIRGLINNLISIITGKYLKGDDFTDEARKKAYSFIGKVQEEYLLKKRQQLQKQELLNEKLIREKVILDRYKQAIQNYYNNADVYKGTKGKNSIDMNKINNLNIQQLNKEINKLFNKYNR